MVNKTNVLEIQLNGTQSGCKFLDVKGFGQFILGAEKNKAHKRQNTAKNYSALLYQLLLP